MCDAAFPGLAVGFFDGVHRGHQAILRRAKSVLTFRNHPLSVVCPERAPRLIMSFEEREAAIRGCGIENVIALEFTRELANLEPTAFAHEFLAGHRICCGANWRFGRGGAGDAAFLRALGLEVETVSYAEFGGLPVSSTRIREALESGRIESATAMLGHPYRISARLAHGKGEGRALGFPTVNLLPEHLELLLPRGVYAVKLGGKLAIANFGVAPTFGDRAWPTPVLEVHFLSSDDLPSFEDPLQGVEFKRFIRPERTFASRTDLQRQIAADCEAFSVLVSEQ